MRFGFIVERLLQLVPVLLGVSLVVFLMMTLTPGDPVEIMLGDQRVTPEQKESLRHDMGLDLPATERFVHFVANAVKGDFGRSFFHRRPVADVIAERLPATLELTIVAMLIALAVGIPLGVLAAVRRGSLIDKAATVISLIGTSMPGFWFGIMLILFFAVYLGWMPVSGRIDLEFEVPRITGMYLIDSVLSGRLDAFLNVLVVFGDGAFEVQCGCQVRRSCADEQHIHLDLFSFAHSFKRTSISVRQTLRKL